MLSFIVLVSIKDAIADTAQEYGVYVEPTSEIADYIADFNGYIAKKRLLKKYKVKPYLDEKYPVYITLYLTSFSDENIDNVKDELVHISNNVTPFGIETTDIVADPSGYVMLNIKDNSILQHLSNESVTELSRYRNQDYQMPSWVRYHPAKMESFKHYGSPNTFEEYNPHFTIMAFDFVNENQREEFLEDMTAAIIEFKQHSINATVDKIALGKVESHGQITKELAMEYLR